MFSSYGLTEIIDGYVTFVDNIGKSLHNILIQLSIFCIRTPHLNSNDLKPLVVLMKKGKFTTFIA